MKIINDKINEWNAIIQKIQVLLEPVGPLSCDAASLSLNAMCEPDLTIYMAGNTALAKQIAKALPELKWMRVPLIYGINYEASADGLKVCLFKAEPLEEVAAQPIDLASL